MIAVPFLLSPQPLELPIIATELIPWEMHIYAASLPYLQEENKLLSVALGVIISFPGICALRDMKLILFLFLNYVSSLCLCLCYVHCLKFLPHCLSFTNWSAKNWLRCGNAQDTIAHSSQLHRIPPLGFYYFNSYLTLCVLLPSYISMSASALNHELPEGRGCICLPL